MTLEIPKNFNLGYACLNETLREQGIFTSRTLRLATVKEKGVNYIKMLIIHNLRDLFKILKWNVQNKIFLYRMSSETFPFITHPDVDYDLDFVDDILKEIGRYARLNKVRLSFHPGQYTLLNSIHPHVIVNAVKDLAYHADVMDRMRLDKNSVIVIHGGTRNRPTQLCDNIKLLSQNIRDRLVLENCENCYNVEQLLPICEELDVPLIFDSHHDAINRSSKDASEYFDRIFAVWDKRGIKPKFHLSNSEPGILDTDNITKRRKHSEYITFFHTPLLTITRDIDIMLEVKAKELALQRIRGF